MSEFGLTYAEVMGLAVLLFAKDIDMRVKYVFEEENALKQDIL